MEEKIRLDEPNGATAGHSNPPLVSRISLIPTSMAANSELLPPLHPLAQWATASASCSHVQVSRVTPFSLTLEHIAWGRTKE